MEHFGVATLCHISRSQEQRNMACDVLLLLSFYTFVLIAIVQVPDYNPSPVTEADKATKAKFAKVLG